MKKIKQILPLILFLVFAACKKNTNDDGTTPSPEPVDTSTIQTPVDPPVAATIGFFLNDWQPKNFSPIAYVDSPAVTSAATTVTVNAASVLTKIPRSIAGDNANLWITQMVTEPALMTHLTKLNPHIIRFPGGSIADVFFWNAPKGVPPADAPASLLRADGSAYDNPYWYGRNNESWTLSLDNYYKMLEQTGNEGIIIVNYGYARYGTGPNPVAAAAHLAADWVRYDNGRTKYWEAGNENFGEWEAGYRIDRTKNKDGQPEIITGAVYGEHFKVFADSMRKAAQEIGKTIYIGAVLVESQPQDWQTPTVKTWNAGVFSKAGNVPDFHVVHNYYTPYQQNSTAAQILTTPITETKKMTDFVAQQVQANGVNPKPVALTEWNIFAEGSMQQVSHVNGMHAVMVVGEALKNKLGMTARWDIANGWNNGNDHGMFSLGEAAEGVPKWVPRPAFYHLYFFKKFLGDRLVASTHNNSNLETYASTLSSGQANITLVNKAATEQTVEVKMQNFRTGNRFYWYALTGGNDNGEFSRKVFVNGKGPLGAGGGPDDYATLKPNSAATQNGIKLKLPPRSVVCVLIDKK